MNRVRQRLWVLLCCQLSLAGTALHAAPEDVQAQGDAALPKASREAASLAGGSRLRLKNPLGSLGGGDSDEARLAHARKIHAAMQAFKDLPPVGRLPRPVLLIAGGKPQKIGMKNFIDYFSAGGANQFGGVFHPAKREEFIEEFRRMDPSKGQFVVTLQFSRVAGTFENDTDEIRQALDTIHELTGSKVDCLAESKATIEARLYLHQSGDKISNLVLLVPIIKGFPVAGELGWVASHLPMRKIWGYDSTPEAREMIRGWVPDVAIGPWVWNSLLHALNSPENLARERERVERLTLITGDGYKMMQGQIGSGLPLPWLRGDRSVALLDTILPSADETIVLTGDYTLHHEMWVNPRVLLAVARVFQEGTAGTQLARKALSRLRLVP